MKLAFAIACLASLALAGCSSAPAGPVTPPMKDGKYIIHMTAANTFVPADAKVPVGATVAWVSDAGVHDVKARDGSFDSDREGGKIQANGQYVHTFSAAGDVPYVCSIHESTGMVGTLRVVAA